MSYQPAENNQEQYLDFWSNYAKKPLDWANMVPKDRTDFRERLRRETVRGKTTFLHENIENYIFRQAKAYTTFRVFSHWLLAYLIARRCALVFLYTFPEMSKHGFMKHPNYIKLGHFWSWTYLLRVPFMVWITLRVTKQLYERVRDQANGKEDLLTSLQYDWQYDDLFRDIEDQKMVNFRYGDHRDRGHYLEDYSHMVHKADADRAKAAFKWYRYGNDSFFDWFFKPLKLS